MSENDTQSNPLRSDQTNVQRKPEKMRIIDFSQSSWDAAVAYNEHGIGKDLIDEVNARADRDCATLR